MIREKVRKEVSLDKTIVERLKIQALEDGRSLKNYLEKILPDTANDDFEITEGYKKMMDEMLEKREKGELKFISEEEFRASIKRK